MKKEDILSIVPLLPAQQFILTASLRDGQQTYVQQLFFEVRNFDGNALQSALNKLTLSYECLQSIILHEGLKQAVWVSLKNMHPEFNFQQIAHDHLDGFCDERLNKGFQFDKEVAMRLDWIETEQNSFLLITYHHLLFDGWGRQKILSDFLFTLKFPQSQIPKKFNKSWYESWKKLDQASAVQAYQKYLLDFENIAKLTFIGKGLSKNATFSDIVSNEKISNSARSLGLTQAEFVLFSWACFISKWTDSENVQLGQVKQNGLIETCRDGFGLGIQTLPFQLQLDFNEKVSELLTRFKNRERSVSPFPYVDTTQEVFNRISYDFILAFENYPIDSSLHAFNDEFKLLKNYDYSEFPLSLAVTPKEGNLIFDWHFNEKYHTREQIEAVSYHFINCLENLSQFLDTRLDDIDFWPPSHLHQHNLKEHVESFLTQLEKNIKNKDRFDLYKELSDYILEKDVRRIWLVGDKHIYSDLLIVAAWRNSVEVLSLNEKESTDFMQNLAENHPADLIFSSVLLPLFPEAILMDNLFKLPKDIFLKVKNKSKAALLICTSGTTGMPKVVQLSIENLVAFFESWNNKLPWKENEIFAVIAHPAFDIGIAELIFPLWKNYQIKIIDKETLSNQLALNEIMSDVTAFHMVPSLLESWIDNSEGDTKSRIVMTGGDKVPPHLQSKLKIKFPKARLFQFYGPSECSVLSSGFENNGQFENHFLPLGTPFDHAEMLIFSSREKLAPPFQEGEIVVRGPAVGLGYANSDNSDKFFDFKGERAYRTGDLGFADIEENFFFRGRKDNQIKINGQRIELSRIESALSEWSGIKHWITISDGNRLFAFAKSVKPEKELDRTILQKWLPFYAIPSFIEYFPEFPLNKNGKVDTKTLLESAIGAISEIQKNGIIDGEFEAILKELFPTKEIDFSIGWYANGLNSIDALKFSGILKTKLKLYIELNHLLSLQNLFDLNKIKSIDKSESPTKKIQIGDEVYSTASRILFLSESDEQFFESYWITSGILYKNEFNENEIRNWLLNQNFLHLSVSSKDSKYFWTKAVPQIIDFGVISESEFVNKVERAFSSLDTSLFMAFFGKTENDNFLAIKVHHALLDGLGVENLWQKLHHDLMNNQMNELTLTIPNEDVIDSDFWQNYLNGIEIKNLPFERAKRKNRGGSRINFKLNDQQKEVLKSICIGNSCSLFEAGLVLFSRFWFNYFNSKDFAIGIPVNIGEFEDGNFLSAMSVNILPFKIASEKSAQILEDWRLVFQKRKTPFSEIARLDKNQKNGLPFFNCTYLYHSQKEGSKGFKTMDFNRAQTDYLISLDFIEDEKDFIFSWEYRNDLFTEKAIQKFQEKLFKDAQIVQSKTYPAVRKLKSKWEEVLRSFSSKTALILENKILTYSELQKLMDEYHSGYKIETEELDVLILERNELSIAKLLYHITEGIPFIPVDAETAEERINHIRTRAKEINPNSDDYINLQYVIATSGTTGIPKLVGVSKAGYESAVEAWTKDYEINSTDCCLQAASFSFDVSLGDIGRCFFNGASMVLLSGIERKDPAFMLQKIDQNGVTIFETTPLIVRWWLSDGIALKDYSSLRLLIVGSDSWKMNEIRALLQHKGSRQRIISSYGLSETTIDNSFFDPVLDDHPEYPDEMIVPIGKSMSHCDLIIKNDRSEIVLEGMNGFISVTGPAVGFGYFVDGKWTNKTRTEWLSADRGVIDEWGNYHFLGRSDRQVKIRGQRVELEEIEKILSIFSSGKMWSIVDFNHDLSTEMAAFYVGNYSKEEINQIKKEISLKYPSYFLPSLFINIDNLPLNVNGKIDLNILRKIAISKLVYSEKFGNNVEITSLLQEVYSQCFNEVIKLEDNFFQNGKNSFDAMFFVRSWNKLSDHKMAVHQLFSSENFIQLGKLISYNKPTKVTAQESEKISKAQEAIWFEIKNGNSTLYNLPHFIPISSDFNPEKVRIAFEQTLKQCKALFVRFYETDLGDVHQLSVESQNYILPKLTIENLDDFKEKASLKEINFSNGPCFESALIECKNQFYIYFNPHHLVYDGGSDIHLSKLFRDFYENVFRENVENSLDNNSFDVNWQNYFQLNSKPEFYFHKPNTSVQPALILPCSEIELSHLHQLTIAYQTTKTSIISYLLCKALHDAKINVNWISLAVDHRTHDCVGMHMRAYPFPGYEEYGDPDLTIAKQKWALSQLFASSDQTVIYPEATTYEVYHQVGLIIQHPFNLNINEKQDERIEYSRPRLPLSLYVEEINEQLIFRWEFDNGQITMKKIREVHANFFNSAKELLAQDKKIISYNPEFNSQKNVSLGDEILFELMQIWKKYTGERDTQFNHFFEAGGNSIKALLMLKEIETKLGFKFSASEFFKQPKLSYLNATLNRPAKNNLVWEFNQGEGQQEIWLLPPIMGFGFIFNSLKLPNDYKILSFNYPASMGLTSCESIEEIAQLLIRERLNQGGLSEEITLIGYSMGALTAFEMAKWLEENGFSVKRLIVLDKIAQPESGKNFQKIDLKEELLDIAKQVAIDDQDLERIKKYLVKHEQMIEAYQQTGELNCNIQIHYCANGFPVSDFLKWQRFCKNQIYTSEIANCGHYEIPKIWNKLNFDF